MTTRTGTYEVRNDRLFVDGEPVGIDRRIVREVLRQYQTETGRSAGSPIPPSLVDRILKLDRRIALARLKADLHGAWA